MRKLKGVEMRKMRLLNKNIIQQAYVTTLQCKFCNSLSVVRYGLTEKGKQRFLCQKCKRTFVTTNAPERMRYSTKVIASAINQFYESSSLHKIKRQLQLDFGVRPDHSTIYNWIVRYTKKATKAFENTRMKVGNTWVADETVLKLKSGGGENVWLFDCFDEDSKFLLATHLTPNRYTKDAQILMERAEKRAGKMPKVVITDKLRSYLRAMEETFGDRTKHHQSRPFALTKSTRSIERLHGTIKDRTKIMRGLASKESAKLMMDGWGIHYNFFRPHGGLGSKTPAEAAGIDVPFKNWAEVVKGETTNETS